MSLRPTASASIAFGLVAIPVKLYSAHTAAHRFSFNWLHKTCGSRLRQQYVCREEETVVESKDMVKGYEFSKGKYVQYTPEEIKAFEQESNRAIEIKEFVPLDQVDLLYYDKAHYLAPDVGSERAYALLAAALERSKRVAVAQYAAHGKQYLVLVRVAEHVMILQQLHYADEIQPRDAVPVKKPSVKADELRLALQMIEQGATAAFDASKYHDQVQQRMRDSIDKRIKGEAVHVATTHTPAGKVVDLMEALKASLQKQKPVASRGTKRKPAKAVTNPRNKRRTQTS